MLVLMRLLPFLNDAQVGKRKNMYGEVWTQEIVDKLHHWAVVHNGAKRLRLDPEQLKVVQQVMDYGQEHWTGIETRSLPMPKSEYEWESYELFLATLIDCERERNADLLRQIRRYETMCEWFLVPLRWIGVRYCTTCATWVFRHRCPYEDRASPG